MDLWTLKFKKPAEVELDLPCAHTRPKLVKGFEAWEHCIHFREFFLILDKSELDIDNHCAVYLYGCCNRQCFKVLMGIV